MQTVPVAIEPADAAYWPLDKLLPLQEQNLRSSRILERAARSSLYASRIPRLGKLTTRESLRTLPLTSAEHLRAALRGRSLSRLAAVPPYIWLSSSSVDDRKWIPQAAQDLRRTMGILSRLLRLLRIEPHEVVLVISQPAPLFQNSLPYLLMYADRWDTDLHLELIVGSMAMAEHNDWPEFAMRRQPTLLIARPSDTLSLADRFARAGNPNATLPREAFSRLRRGLFYGEPLAGQRARLEDAFGLEAFGVYASVEYPYYACECPSHAGLHVWLDLSLPEVIPDEEAARVDANRRYEPMTFFLDQAPTGLEGELVVTTLAHSLPMIRYRTGDRVRVISSSPCPCTCTHPRIEVLGRHPSA